MEVNATKEPQPQQQQQQQQQQDDAVEGSSKSIVIDMADEDYTIIR